MSFTNVDQVAWSESDQNREVQVKGMARHVAGLLIKYSAPIQSYHVDLIHDYDVLVRLIGSAADSLRTAEYGAKSVPGVYTLRFFWIVGPNGTHLLHAEATDTLATYIKSPDGQWNALASYVEAGIAYELIVKVSVSEYGSFRVNADLNVADKARIKTT